MGLHCLLRSFIFLYVGVRTSQETPIGISRPVTEIAFYVLDYRKQLNGRSENKL
jgi:hypothetical protein